MITDGQCRIKLNQPCQDAVKWAADLLKQDGLQVMQTFDFDMDHSLNSSCTCLYHGSDHCDCQVAVLLVYGDASQPVSLLIHGHVGQTWLTLVETYLGNNGPLEERIRKVLYEAENWV